MGPNENTVPAPPEIVAEITKKFNEAALPFAGAPIHCNRFLITPSDYGPVLILGGVFAGMLHDGTSVVHARPIVAINFAKNVAEDLVIQMEMAFGITEEDRQNARSRNSDLPSQ